MRAWPERPGDDVYGPDAPPREADGDAADLLNRPSDRESFPFDLALLDLTLLDLGLLDLAFASWGRPTGVTADDRRHHARHGPAPAVPGTGPGEAEFGLGRLGAVLDRPAPAFDRDQGPDRGAGRASGGGGQVPVRAHGAVRAVAADRQAPPPEGRDGLAVSGRVATGRFATGPVVGPRALAAGTRRHPPAGASRPRRGESARIQPVLRRPSPSRPSRTALPEGAPRLRPSTSTLRRPVAVESRRYETAHAAASVRTPRPPAPGLRFPGDRPQCRHWGGPAGRRWTFRSA